MNNNIDSFGLGFYNIGTFVSNNMVYDGISSWERDDGWDLAYNTPETKPYGINVYLYDSGWINDSYRTLVFSVPPTGDLLTWLQANGTKQ